MYILNAFGEYYQHLEPYRACVYDPACISSGTFVQQEIFVVPYDDGRIALTTKQVEIDLDDGGKVNYHKFGKILKKLSELN